MLHARTGFADTAERHLQGCYADLDAVASQAMVLHGQLVADRIGQLFDSEGLTDYLGEDVSQAQHMLQTAAMAEHDGAPPALVVASLLHDVGHFTGPLTGHDLMAGSDNRHSHVGADWLARWFGPAVTEPVRLHVAAKRYLCAVDPAYASQLCEASTYTLRVQGGPMSPAESTSFKAEPYAADSIHLRRWDDGAKDAGLAVPSYDHYAPTVARLARR
jgi:gamma-butyrobetaine dioxygenase